MQGFDLFIQTLLIGLGVFLTIALLGVIGGYFFLIGYRKRGREQKSLSFVLLKVMVPRDNEIKIDAAEQMFAAFYSVYHSGFLSFLTPQEHFSFELAVFNNEIHFYVSVPKHLKDLVEKQITGAYPGSYVTEEQEYNIFSPDSKVAFASLKLKSSNFFPIKTYKDLPTDTLSSITSTLALVSPGQGAIIQMLFSPASNAWRGSGRSYVSKLKQAEMSDKGPKAGIDAKMVEAVENKVSKVGFETVVRIVVAAGTQPESDTMLDNITAAFSQYTSDYNHFSAEKSRFKKSFMMDFIYRYMPARGKNMILTAEELASLYHFPNKSVETPSISWLNYKRAPAPARIAEQGLHMGKSVYRGLEKQIFLGDDDRRRHLYLIGKTGTGKSELLKYMVMQDIRAGKGVAFIDPHGDAVEDILKMIPQDREEDVVYFDPSDTERPMGMNMIEVTTDQEKNFMATYIIGLMYKLYDPHKTGIIGPRFEHAIRNAMLTIMDTVPGGTFIEVVQALQRPDYIQELLPYIKDPIVKRYWTDQIAQTTDFHKSEVLDYIVSKFGRFVTDPLIRHIIGQSKSSLNFRQIMDEGKILLVNLSKGRIGEEDSSFLGLILVPRILMAAMSRQNIPMEERKDFYLYVDEFQNFATETFADILSEARKYRLNLIVANQFIGQIEEEVKDAIFGNVGTLVTYRVGVQDATYLAHEFAPTFTEGDLINIERFHTYVKTIVNNEPVPPFSMDVTRDLTKDVGSNELAEMIKGLSRLKYGQDVRMVEAEITERARL